MIVTIDLGTTHTKVAWWADGRAPVVGRCRVASTHPGVGRVEQDATEWWSSVVRAARSIAAGVRPSGTPDALVLTGARQTFVPIDAAGEPIGPAVLWSDRRAGREAERLARSLGGMERARAALGIVLDGGSVPAKMAWLAANEPGRLDAARWLATPRDLAAWQLTGEQCTDRTMASAGGLLGGPAPGGGPAGGGLLDGPTPEIVELVGIGDRLLDLLPEVVASTTVIGGLRPEPAAALGLPRGLPVVIGAGDRACEVLGSGAGGDSGAGAGLATVSWGTTANVSVPSAAWPDPIPEGMTVSAGALGGWVIEGGLSAAGALVAWLGDLTGEHPDALLALAATAPPGARGVTVLPWLGGARAPWWRADVGAAVLGLGPANGPADLARAVVEGVARDVCRCLDKLAEPQPEPQPQPLAEALALALAGGSAIGVWTSVLTAMAGRPAIRRGSAETASAGAAYLGHVALGRPGSIDDIDPVVEELAPDPALVALYRSGAADAERAALAVLAATGASEDVP